MKSILTLLLVVLMMPCFGQSDYTIKFDQTMESEDSTTQAAIDMVGEVSLSWYISGKKFRIETTSGMTGTTSMIYDGASKKLLMLIESPFLGNTYSLIHDTLDVPEPEFTVTKTKETKEIAGYKCVKYIVKDAESNLTMLYVTSKIPAPSKSEYGDKISGTVLSSITVLEANGATIKMNQTASLVSKRQILADKFSLEIPEGYTEFDANAWDE